MSFDMGSMDGMHIDVLKEIGNIGAGNAATSLSKLLNRRVNMKVPEARVIKFNEVESVVGGAETLVAGIYLEFIGDIEGTIMFILDFESARNLVSYLVGDNAKEKGNKFTPIESSALREVGNILTGAYLGSLSGITGLNVRPSTPSIAYDMAGAILSVPMIEFGQVGEAAFFIETVFVGELNQIKGNFFLIPDVNSYHTILNSVGVE